MSDFSKVSSESMKMLTEKVIRSDMASRKRKMIHISATRAVSLVWAPVICYTFYVRFIVQLLLLAYFIF
jgi:hypothetical protein